MQQLSLIQKVSIPADTRCKWWSDTTLTSLWPATLWKRTLISCHGDLITPVTPHMRSPASTALLRYWCHSRLRLCFWSQRLIGLATRMHHTHTILKARQCGTPFGDISRSG
jgi:hypothetical protein